MARKLAYLLAAAALAPAAASAAPSGALELRPAARLAPAAVAAVIAEYELPVDVERLARAPGSIALELPDGRSIAIRRREVAVRGAGDLVWRGRVRGGGDAILTLRAGHLAATIWAPGALFEIVPEGAGRHRLVEVDAESLEICAGVRETAAASFAPAAEAVADPGARIDLLGVYSGQVLAALGSPRAVETFFQHNVDLTNLSYKNSRVRSRVRLVHAALVSVPDGPSAGDSFLSWVQTHPEVAALREEHGADVVGLIYERQTRFCGSAAMLFRPGFNGAGQAFFVMQRACGASSLTFPHEVGHLQGADHNPENASSANGHSAYGFGHYHSGEYRTVMSYSDPCTGSCPAAPFFSSPKRRFQRRTTGIANKRDNARVLEETAELVAGFATRDGGSGGCPHPAGHPDFCRDCGPCRGGEGDCDGDAECDGELVCAEEAGAGFGLAADVDVCVRADACPVEPGDPDFCALCGPCGFGEGDCDHDLQCQEGLFCLDDVGADYGYDEATDVCGHEANRFCTLPPGHRDYCEVCGPCDLGEGNCKSDSECAAFSLECVANVGGRFGLPAGTDLCLFAGSGGDCPFDPGHRSYCAACGLCDVGEGDCDGDRQCRRGLRCADGAGPDFGLGAGIDVCVEADRRGKPRKPTELRAEALSPTRVEVRWRDNSDNEETFLVQVRREKKRFKRAAIVSADVTRIVLDGLDPGTSYTFRVRARSLDKKSKFSKKTTVETPR